MIDTKHRHFAAVRFATLIDRTNDLDGVLRDIVDASSDADIGDLSRRLLDAADWLAGIERKLIHAKTISD